MYSPKDVASVITFILGQSGGVSYSELIDYLTNKRRGNKFSLFDSIKLVNEAIKDDRIGSFRYHIEGADTKLASVEYIQTLKSQEKGEDEQVSYELDLLRVIGVSEKEISDYFYEKVKKAGSTGYSYQEAFDEMMRLGYLNPDPNAKKRTNSNTVNRILGLLTRRGVAVYDKENMMYYDISVSISKVRTADPEEVEETNEDLTEGEDDLGFSIFMVMETSNVRSFVVEMNNKLFPSQEVAISGSIIMLDYERKGDKKPFHIFEDVRSITLKDAQGEVVGRRIYNEDVTIYVYVS